MTDSASALSYESPQGCRPRVRCRHQPAVPCNGSIDAGSHDRCDERDRRRCHHNARRRRSSVDGAIGKMQQIDSTPWTSRWPSMNPTITFRGGRAPPGQNTPTLCGSRSRASARALRALAPSTAAARPSPIRGVASVTLGVANPARTYRSCTQLRRRLLRSPPIATVFRPVLAHQPHGSFADFWGIRARSCRTAILSRNRPSDNPDTIHQFGAEINRSTSFWSYTRCLDLLPFRHRTVRKEVKRRPVFGKPRRNIVSRAIEWISGVCRHRPRIGKRVPRRDPNIDASLAA